MAAGMLGCAKAPTTPTWISNPEGFIGCAPIINNNLVTARIIATNKAKAEYLSNKQVNMTVNTIHASSKDTQGNITDDFNHTVSLNTEGTVDHTFKVIKEEIVKFSSTEQLCVLMN